MLLQLKDLQDKIVSAINKINNLDTAIHRAATGRKKEHSSLVSDKFSTLTPTFAKELMKGLKVSLHKA